MGLYWFFVHLACTDIWVDDLPQPGGAPNLRVLIHGSGDTADDWPQDLKDVMIQVFPDGDTWDVWTYDWDEYADSKLSASKSGYELGEQMAYLLLDEPYEYEHIHLVAHSVGCFVTFGIAEHLFNQKSNITVHSTYLDPFTGHGMINWGFGERNFGQYSHFSESYYNRDDSVPSTNGSLEFAHNFDVTALRPEQFSEDEFHWWPIEYYLQSIEDDSLMGYGLSEQVLLEGAQAIKERYPPGEETVLE